MSKTVKSILLVFGIIFLASFMAIAQDAGWFDMENCDMCRPLTEDPELLDNLTWEIYEISNGIVMLTTVNEGFEKSYEKVNTEMNKVVDRIMKGEKVQLCNSCQFMNQIYMRAPKVETIKTQNGDISIMTSDNPELVADLKTWARRSNEEMAKLEAKEIEHKLKHEH